MSAKSGDDDIKDEAKSTDFGLNLGLGYRVNANISVEAQYSLGLSNIDDSGEDEVSAKNTNIALYGIYHL